MEDPRHGDEDTEASVEGPGFKSKIRGFRMADVVLAVVVIWALAVKPYFDTQRDNERETAIAKEHAAIAAAQEKIAVAFTEFSYIISMPQEQRSALNLTMPQSLREKLLDLPQPRRFK